MRTPWAILGSAALATLGAAILGEYSLLGPIALLAGALYGVLAGEAVVVLQRRPTAIGIGAAAVFPLIGWVWSLWISTGHHLSFASVTQWSAAGVAGLAGMAWTGTAARTTDRVRRRAGGEEESS